MTRFANAFVTGSTGLLGNNLVRNLIKRGIRRGRLLPQQDSQRSQVFAFLAGHRDMIVNLVLPGWMVGKPGGRNLTTQKSERELGLTFRPVEVTFSDVVALYRANGNINGGK
jgi:hypothetical protein